MSTINGLNRTHYCGELSLRDINQEVVAMGWVSKVRDLGGLVFVDLRDRSGILQLVIDEKEHPTAQRLKQEFVIAVRGNLVKRAAETVNNNIKTGEVELIVEELCILSKAETPPFMVSDDINVRDEVRLKHRFIDLRRPAVQQNLIVRHKVAKLARDYFDENGFIEIETPMLTKSTPEGARDYLVPSRVHKGSFYALPQSPQLYKQVLMTSGFDRYFQITKCFRDEDLRADRQPEFTQMDLEMSFTDVDGVININEGFLQKVFKDIMGIDIKLPLPRIKYDDAMNRFGSDKPDTRFGLELCNISDTVKDCGFKVFADVCKSGGSVRCITVPGGGDKFARRELDGLVEYVKTYGAKGLAWISITDTEIKSPIAKFFKEDEIDEMLRQAGANKGDLILFVADKNEIVFDALGHLRLHLAEKLNLINPDEFNLLWVTDFPLLEYDETEKRYVAKHHPFTSPKDEDMHLLETQPEKVYAKAYDIVLNGVEIGGGSIRIHDGEVQKQMFKAIGINEEEANSRFGFLLEAFKYGTPPHGGLAYGLDRLVMLLCGCQSIREVIAFPKVQNASELMTAAPTPVDSKQLAELGINIAAAEKDES